MTWRPARVLPRLGRLMPTFWNGKGSPSCAFLCSDRQTIMVAPTHHQSTFSAAKFRADRAVKPSESCWQVPPPPFSAAYLTHISTDKGLLWMPCLFCLTLQKAPFKLFIYTASRLLNWASYRGGLWGPNGSFITGYATHEILRMEISDKLISDLQVQL